VTDAPPLRIARIDRLHGLRGEVAAQILTDYPERFARLSRVRVGRTAAAAPRRLEGSRLHKGKVLLKLEGVDGVEAATELIGCDVWVEAAEAVALPAGTYYHRDLMGLEVFERTGGRLGPVAGILRTGGTDVLVVATEAGEVLVPAARSICVEVDLARHRILVELPAGLRELNAD